jgi:hypothetical protein
LKSSRVQNASDYSEAFLFWMSAVLRSADEAEEHANDPDEREEEKSDEDVQEARGI